MSKLFPIIFSLLVLLVACNQNQNADGIYDQSEDTQGTKTLSNKNADAEDDYEMDRTMSDQDPNFPDFDRNRVNQGDDVEQAKKAIAKTGEFTTDSVWINGGRMWVAVHKKGQLSQKEKRDAEARLHKVLIKALPRYNIEVRVQEDRT